MMNKQSPDLFLSLVLSISFAEDKACQLSSFAILSINASKSGLELTMGWPACNVLAFLLHRVITHVYDDYICNSLLGQCTYKKQGKMPN
jgi:hypothetical protein